MIRHPELLPNKENAIVLIGDQGIGKDFIVDYFSDYVIGRNLVSRMTGIGEAINSFNSTLRSKVLCVVNEMASTREAFRSNFDKIKPHISNTTQMINQKGIDAYSVENISSWLFLSNHEDVLYLEKGDRRYTCLRGNPIYKGNHQHFKNVADKCFNDKSGQHMMTYLMRLKPSDVMMPSLLKTTKFKEELKAMSRSSTEKFIDEIMEYRAEEARIVDETSILDDVLYLDDPTAENVLEIQDWKLSPSISAKELFQHYIEWCKENNEKPSNSTKFGVVVAKNSKWEKKRTNRGNFYHFN
jgi:hypothetical protein